MTNWTPVTKANPCPACGKSDWCAWTPDGQILRCMRGGATPSGMRQMSTDAEGGTRFAFDDDNRAPHRTNRPQPKPPTSANADWSATVERLRVQITPQRLEALAKATGVPADAWAKLTPGWAGNADLRAMHASGAGWMDNYPAFAWATTEHRGDGRVVGVSLRAEDGRKGAPAGSAGAKRGIVLPVDLHNLPDPVLIVEGASDVAACCALGLAAVGRPSNRAGAADLSDLLDGRDVLVVGERDGKDSGAWPGRDGAKAIAAQLASRWNAPVRWTLPPADTKDVRAWLQARSADGLNLSDPAACRAAGAELRSALEQNAKPIKPAKRSQADALVDLALERFRLGVTETGDTFAVAHEGPKVAKLFRGGRDALRAALAKAYRETIGKTPTATALADALTTLEGMALDCAPEPVALRVAQLTDANLPCAVEPAALVLDLGDTSGRALVIHPSRWELVEQAPILFRRTALTAALPEPAELDDPAALLGLRSLLNVSDDAWPLLVGWLVAAWFPAIPHPVLMLGGEQGTGKSTAARLLVGLIDPSPAPLRSEPRDMDQWAIAAAGSWVVVLDNVSSIGNWWSDALCKAVTGDGWVKRKLYTDDGLAVLTFRRCIMLTSIDAGALRGDLGDRLLLIDLERIADKARQTDAALMQAYEADRPRLLAGLLSAIARTLEKLPGVQLDTMPRMADFAHVLGALDRACPELTNGRALPLFISQRQQIADDVVDADMVAGAIRNLIEQRGRWSGTSAELLAELTPKDDDGKPRPPKQWPRSARGMSGQLKRIVPALRSIGIEVENERDNSKNRTRRLSIWRPADSIVQTVRTSDVPPVDPGNGDLLRTVEADQLSEPAINRPHSNPAADAPAPFTDDADGTDDQSPASCPDVVEVRL